MSQPAKVGDRVPIYQGGNLVGYGTVGAIENGIPIVSVDAATFCRMGKPPEYGHLSPSFEPEPALAKCQRCGAWGKVKLGQDQRGVQLMMPEPAEQDGAVLYLFRPTCEMCRALEGVGAK